MRHTRPATFLVALLLASGAWLTMSAAPQNDRQAETQMQTARNRAFVDGEVDDAIRLYQRIVATSGVSDSIKAQALVEMGRLYEKQGNAEAEKAYARVVRQFAAQTRAADEARSRLQILGVTDSLASIAAAGPRRIAEGRGAAISSDGRYLFQPSGTAEVADLATGEVWSMVTDNRMGLPNAAFSPDSREIAYAVTDDNHPPYSKYAEMRVAPLRPRSASGKRVFSREDIIGIAPFGWSPDGSTVFALLTRRDETNVIASISRVSGEFRAIKSLEWRWPNRLSLSPDGRYIAYDAPLERQSTNRDIFILPTDGGHEVALTDHAARDAAPIWTPGAEAIVFASDRQGETALWMMEVREGRPAGEAQLLRRDAGAWWPIGFTSDGTFYYQAYRGARQPADRIASGEIDLVTGIVTRSLIDLRGLGGGDYAPAYSADGRELAYFSQKGTGFRPDTLINSGFLTLVVRSLISGDEQYFATPFTDVASATWLPDRSLAIVGRTDTDPYPYVQYSLHRIDLQTGRDLISHIVPASWRSHTVASQDGKQLYYLEDVGAPNRGPHRKSIMALELETQRTLKIGEADALFGEDLVLSSDGRHLALSQDGGRKLLMVPTSGGVPRRFDLFPANFRGLMIKWSSDGSEILVQKLFNEGLWWVRVEDGAMRQVGSAARLPRIEAVHPDGKRFVSVGGAPRDTSGDGVWVAPDILPNSSRRHIFVAKLDAAARRVLGPATPIRRSLVRLDQSPSWLPDGKRIAYQRVRPNTSDSDLVVHSLATGAETVYSVSQNTFCCYFYTAKRLTWLRDGAEIVRVSLPADSPSIERLVMGSPELEKRTQGALVHALSPDGRTLYVMVPVGATSAVAVFDMATEKKMRQFSIPPLPNGLRLEVREMSVSPDGGALALWTNAGLLRLSTDGTKLVALLDSRSPDSERGTRPVWTKDGRAILIGVSRDDRTWRLMSVPVAGGKPAFTGLETTGPREFKFGFDVSPDGSQIVFDGISPSIMRAGGQ